MHSRPTSRKRVLLGGVIGLAAIAGCASFPTPEPIAVEQRDWTAPGGTPGVQLLTDHYDLRVTTRDALLQEYLAPFMETAFAEYTLLIPSTRESPDRLVVYLFGTTSKARTTSVFVGGEILEPEESCVPGTGFYETVTSLPVLQTIYRDGDCTGVRPAIAARNGIGKRIDGGLACS